MLLVDHELLCVPARRNLHPTTRLLHSFPGHGQLPPSTLIISSTGVILCSCHSSRAAAAAATTQSSSSRAVSATGGGDVQKVQLIQWQLPGVPVSCAAVGDNRYIVGDDTAGELSTHEAMGTIRVPLGLAAWSEGGRAHTHSTAVHTVT